MDEPLRAYVDESYRSMGTTNGVYLFAAASVCVQHEEVLRDELVRLRGKTHAIHWTNDRETRRKQVLDRIATMPIHGLTVYRADVPHRRAERTRQHALWNLADELRKRNVHDAIFEAREHKLNERDERTLASIARTAAVSPEFAYRFAGKHQEPLLALADYIAGAVGELLVRDERRYVDRLPATSVEIVELPPQR